MTRFQIRAKLQNTVSKESITGFNIRTRLKKKSKSVLRTTAYVGATASGVVLMTLAGVSSAQAVSINGTKISGAWEKIGNAKVVNGNAVITAGAAGVSDVESFLGLASGTLNNINTTGATATSGSAIRKTISVAAGDVLNLGFLFQANDELPFNDFAFYSISPDTALFLADVANVGNYGAGGGQDSYTFDNAGTYTIGFVAFNAEDNTFNSTLTVDNVEAVPEPLTILGTLAAGGIGTAMRRKAKKQEKDAVKA